MSASINFFVICSAALKPNNVVGFKVDSDDTPTTGVVAFGSSVCLSLPNLNPPINSSLFLPGSMDAPNLKPPFSVLVGSTDATVAGTVSIFLGSIVFPNLNPGVSFTSFDTSAVALNLNPVDDSSFLPDDPNENPDVCDKVVDCVPNFVLV